MKRTFRHSMLAAIAIAFLLAQSLCAQSLGDVARQQREKNKQQAATTNKVLTNEDISGSSQPVDAASSDSQKRKLPKPKSSSPTDQSKNDDAPSAEELKSAIEEKKEAIAEIQDRITKLESTVNYVQNNRNVYTNAPEYNEAQKRKEQEVTRLKGVLQERQGELRDLQDKARAAGYGSSVYD